MTDSSSEDVRFRSDGLTLAGTFVNVPKPRAAALILSGSGKMDRDSNSRSLKSGISRDLADALADNRIASLRFDKRGVRDSDGDFLTSGLTENYSDARSALAWFSARRPTYRSS